MTLTRRRLHELLERHGLTPSRALGQNFVADPNTVRRIARLAGVGAGDQVVEVGAGLGSLTLALAEVGASVTAVEVDRHLVPALTDAVSDAEPAVRVVHADALELDWDELLGPAPPLGPPWVLVANLPYNVGTTIVLRVLDEAPQVSRLLVMVQREVGERLAAPAGGAAYGIPSVRVAQQAVAKVVGAVPASVFLPRPKVDSVLVEIVRRPEPVVEGDTDVLWELVRAGFGQRRKMLRRSLAELVAPGDLEGAGIDPTCRPQELDVATWGRLAAVVAAGRASGRSSP